MGLRPTLQDLQLRLVKVSNARGFYRFGSCHLLSSSLILVAVAVRCSVLFVRIGRRETGTSEVLRRQDTSGRCVLGNERDEPL